MRKIRVTISGSYVPDPDNYHEGDDPVEVDRAELANAAISEHDVLDWLNQVEVTFDYVQET